MHYEGYLGYIKYDGALTQNGVMDARKQAEALLGFDSALRHFIIRIHPTFKTLEFEIPVKVREGSWEALIPETVAGWAQAGLGLAATTYVTTAAKKMAERDFSEFGATDLFRKALDAIKWFAKIGKHLGDLSIKVFEGAKFAENNQLIGIRNSKGEFLYVPKHILDLYIESGTKILEPLANLIEEERTLKIGSVDQRGIDEVTISLEEKFIFCEKDEDEAEDVLFPELRHGESVILEGEVTRENKTSNSMGFKYLDHILTAYPEVGSIVRYKPLLFLRCRLFGTVDRMDEKGRIAARRPKLHFSHLEALESDSTRDLFSDL